MIYLREQFEKIKFIDFENVKEEQVYGAPVTYEGLTYQNNEAAFQAQKCSDTKDREAFTNMNPSEAKKAGRKVLLRKDWEQIKMSVMAGIVKAKFEQNEELAKVACLKHVKSEDWRGKHVRNIKSEVSG